MKKGIFTISLDFELFWGVRHTRNLESYGGNIRAVHEIVPRLLELFERYGVHCSWGTVGMLFCNSKQQVLALEPAHKPQYKDGNLSPWQYIHDHELDAGCHFAPHLIQQIKSAAGQELCTHTFSHYFTLEEGSDPDSFSDDLAAVQKLFENEATECRSIIFPKNQFDSKILDICRQHGIRVYRGFPQNWLYRARNRNQETFFIKVLRYLDSYVNVASVSNPLHLETHDGMVNVPASLFLRPYKSRFSFLEKMKVGRIKNAMNQAAAKGELFHLWWHPHNFGDHTEENFANLEAILQHYWKLHEQDTMDSLNMEEIANLYA